VSSVCGLASHVWLCCLANKLLGNKLFRMSQPKVVTSWQHTDKPNVWPAKRWVILASAVQWQKPNYDATIPVLCKPAGKCPIYLHLLLPFNCQLVLHNTTI